MSISIKSMKNLHAKDVYIDYEKNVDHCVL